MIISRLLTAVLLAPLAGLSASASPTDAWSWPVAPPPVVLRAFEAPPTPYAAGHRGMDLATHPGDPVYAPADGLVSFAGVVVDRAVLSIAHPGDLVSSAEPVDALVSAGERVAAGQLVGRVAAGGHCAAGCIHFGVRLHGRYVSPLLLLGGVPRAVLLPAGDVGRGATNRWSGRESG